MGRHRKRSGAEQTRRGRWVSPQRILEHVTAGMIMDVIHDLFPGLSVRGGLKRAATFSKGRRSVPYLGDEFAIRRLIVCEGTPVSTVELNDLVGSPHTKRVGATARGAHTPPGKG